MYAVITIHIRDYGMERELFQDIGDAAKYLEDIWSNYYNEAIANEDIETIGRNVLLYSECYHEDDFAKIEWLDGDKILFYLIEIPIL